MSDAVVELIRQCTMGRRPRVGVVLGSGWGGLIELLHDAVSLPYADLPGFPSTRVPGHEGALWLGRVGATEVAVMSGRQHAYETGEVTGMKLPLKVLRDLGCEALVLTNAAGSLRPDMPPGSLMALEDHLNLPQRSPLVGEEGAGRFVGMSHAYDPDWRSQAQRLAAARGLSLFQGVYAWCLGPQFETPAEIRMCRFLGAHAVGMSTVPETIWARYLGMRVLALSLITNMAAGLSAEQLSHAHTLAQAQAVSSDASGLLADILASC